MRAFTLSVCWIVLLTAACKKDPAMSESGTASSAGNTSVVPAWFLSAALYDQLIVEIQYMPGVQPSAAAVNNLKSFLEQRLNKPAGISIVQTAIASPGKSTYSVPDLIAVETAKRTQQANGKILTAYILFADGDYSGNSGNSKVLGITYAGTSMAVFESTVKQFSGGLSQPAVSSLETTVLNHEFGHVLGLVNRGTPLQSQHQDTAHDKHCTNQHCLMYYNAETSDIIANMLGTGIPVLDAACIADLRANGGK